MRQLKPNIAALHAYSPGKSAFGAVKLSSNENPLGPSPKAIKAISAIMEQIHRYPNGTYPELREALARHWKVEPDNLIIGNGSDEVFTLLTASWISPGENAVGIRQTFSQYRHAVCLFGAEMREADIDSNGKHNLNAMANLIDENTRIIFLCNPNNPTGTWIGYNELKSFLDTVPSHIICVLDEAYADFAFVPDFPDSRELLRHYDNLVVVRTFSKLYGLAGLRVGYGIAAADVALGAERASLPFKVNTLAHCAALAALDDTEHKHATLNLVKTENTFLSEELTLRGWHFFPTQANFICLDTHRTVAELWEFIARRGIAVRDLASFGLPTMLRYTFGRREHNEKLLSILEEIL